MNASDLPLPTLISPHRISASLNDYDMVADMNMENRARLNTATEGSVYAVIAYINGEVTGRAVFKKTDTHAWQHVR
jgi:hypothetical protein